MEPFYIGQRVVCIETHSWGAVIKDQIYIIKGVKTSCEHHPWIVDVGIKADTWTCGCGTCGKPEITDIWWICATRFAPIQEKFEPITFSKIMEEELISVN